VPEPAVQVAGPVKCYGRRRRPAASAYSGRLGAVTPLVRPVLFLSVPGTGLSAGQPVVIGKWPGSATVSTFHRISILALAGLVHGSCNPILILTVIG
jgi:hypothetical protein